MANEVRKCIINLIKKHRYYSVLIDCTPDISHQGEVSLIIRIVNMHWGESIEPSIQELFINFMSTHSTSGLSLLNLLISKLAEYETPLSNCRGQGYDNGSNMVGEYQGVQSRIRNQNPRAFFAPCAAHKLNLLLCDVFQSCARAITFFGVIERVYTLFSASTKRWNILKNHCSIVVKKWTATRWESRYKCVKAIRDQLSEVLDALGKITECTNDPKSVSEARSLIDKLISFEFVLSLVIWHDILGQVNIVSKILQDPKMDLDSSSSSLNSLIIFFEKYRICGFENTKKVGIEIIECIGGTANFKEKRQRFFSILSTGHSSSIQLLGSSFIRDTIGNSLLKTLISY